MDQRLPEPAATDWRALCEELADALDHNRQCLLDDRRLTHPLADKARAALAAEPVGEWPTDTQLIEEAIAVGLAFQPQDEVSEVFLPFDAEEPLDEELIAYARAVLARFGHQPAQPAEGEVAELAAKLRRLAPHNPLGTADPTITRAADLLELQAAPVPVLPEDAQVIEPTERTILVPAPVPVAVSERLPQTEDCDAEGFCWAWRGFDPDNDDDGEFWQLIHAEWMTAQLGGGWTHWLPANALPLPSDTESGDSNE